MRSQLKKLTEEAPRIALMTFIPYRFEVMAHAEAVTCTWQNEAPEKEPRVGASTELEMDPS